MGITTPLTDYGLVYVFFYWKKLFGPVSVRSLVSDSRG
jgi:hypothetical protein